MTVLQPKIPTIAVEDSFRILYLGTYGAVSNPDGSSKLVVTEVKGPLPYGKYLWDGRDYLGGMQEGQAKLVPFDIVRIYWGDPRSVVGAFGRSEDQKGRVTDIAPRDQEIRRLAGTYGLGVNEIQLIEMVPKVTITNADDVEIICPAFDPEGQHLYGFQEDSAEVHDVATTLARLKQQQALLEQQLKALEERGRNDGADVEVDGPRRKPA